MVKTKPTVRSLVTPMRMNEGMDEEEVPKKKPEVIDGPVLTERDRLKLERRKRKEERQREVKNLMFYGHTFSNMTYCLKNVIGILKYLLDMRNAG